MADHEEEMEVEVGGNVDGGVAPGAGPQENIRGEMGPSMDVEDSLTCKRFYINNKRNNFLRILKFNPNLPLLPIPFEM